MRGSKPEWGDYWQWFGIGWRRSSDDIAVYPSGNRRRPRD